MTKKGAGTSTNNVGKIIDNTGSKYNLYTFSLTTSTTISEVNVSVKIGIIGGTGDIGKGLALRIADKHEIILGSREIEKALKAARVTNCKLHEYNRSSICYGASNEDAAREGDIIVLALPLQHVSTTLLRIDAKYLGNKIVISPINPIGQKNGCFYYEQPEEGSAALAIQKMLPTSTKLVTAFNNIAAHKWAHLNEEIDYTVAVCGDDAEAKKIVMQLVSEISKLHAVDAGPLAMSGIIESITPLLLNIAKLNNLKDVGVHVS
ncbi:MAG TPA: NADPH-dependent F420 reductase [Methanocorpusculum sp.]|nr:NADPH-dependent F420 reductase [Methanocorpusculum sp.]